MSLVKQSFHDKYVQQISANIYAFIQGSHITNSGFVVFSWGVVVIDSLMTVTLANRLKKAIRSVTEKPVKYVVNTHFHGDHVFGNQCFLPARIVGHKNTATVLERHGQLYVTKFTKRFPKLEKELAKVRVVPPVLTFDSRLRLGTPDEGVDLLFFGHGHTSGDIVIFSAEQKVMFAGDLLFNAIFPTSDDAVISSWVKVLECLEKLNPQILIPGHGNPCGKKELGYMLQLLREVLLSNELITDGRIGVNEAVEKILGTGRTESHYASWLCPERLAPLLGKAQKMG